MQNKTLKTEKHIQQQPENTALLLWIESRKVTETPNGLTQERKQLSLSCYVSALQPKRYILYGLFLK